MIDNLKWDNGIVKPMYWKLVYHIWGTGIRVASASKVLFITTPRSWALYCTECSSKRETENGENSLCWDWSYRNRVCCLLLAPGLQEYKETKRKCWVGDCFISYETCFLLPLFFLPSYIYPGCGSVCVWREERGDSYPELCMLMPLWIS